MDKQGERFLNALEEHLDSISADEFYSRLKRNSHPEAQGQKLCDFVDGVDDNFDIDFKDVLTSVIRSRRKDNIIRIICEKALYWDYIYCYIEYTINGGIEFSNSILPNGSRYWDKISFFEFIKSDPLKIN